MIDRVQSFFEHRSKRANICTGIQVCLEITALAASIIAVLGGLGPLQGNVFGYIYMGLGVATIIVALSGAEPKPLSICCVILGLLSGGTSISYGYAVAMGALAVTTPAWSIITLWVVGTGILCLAATTVGSSYAVKSLAK